MAVFTLDVIPMRLVLLASTALWLLNNVLSVRRSRKDRAVLLFYRRDRRRWTCVVVRSDREAAFLVTAYPTDSVKIGELVWTRSG